MVQVKGCRFPRLDAREEARSLSYIETKDAFGLLLFLLLSVARLDACIAQADEIFAVFIGLKTEFQ